MDQTIYTFTGATAGFLTGFAERHPGARILDLTRNYRSTPQVLELANRLIAAERSVEAAGREPGRRTGAGDDPACQRRRGAVALVAGIRGLMADTVAPGEIAVLVRMNAQLEPIEAALTRAGVAYQVRGIRFYDRPEIKAAITSLRRPGLEATGAALVDAIRKRWVDDVGYGEEAPTLGGSRGAGAAVLAGDPAGHRHDGRRSSPSADAAAVLGELDAREPSRARSR